jgi:hypothetical protein
MQTPDRDALERFARDHHVHYEVEHEDVVEGGRRELVGVQVRLFAVHDRPKLGVPGCPECVELLGKLKSFAERVVRAGGASDRSEIVPAASPALYQSSEVQDADEVELTVRVRCALPEHHRPDAGVDPCLRDIHEVLNELGVPRR